MRSTTRTRSTPALIVPAAILALAFICGCQTTSIDGDYATDGMNRQKYDFETVKVRARQLQKGMTTFQVSLLLGSPAQVRGDRWYWRPRSQGPGEVLRVTFDDRSAVKEWGYEPLILGELFR